MRIRIPSALRSYTAGAPLVEGRGATLADMLADLDARFPGIRFRIVDEQDRIRPHIRFFAGEALAKTVAQPLGEDDEVMIVCALSGG